MGKLYPVEHVVDRTITAPNIVHCVGHTAIETNVHLANKLLFQLIISHWHAQFQFRFIGALGHN